jgi:hypothetical protein
MPQPWHPRFSETIVPLVWEVLMSSKLRDNIGKFPQWLT